MNNKRKLLSSKFKIEFVEKYEKVSYKSYTVDIKRREVFRKLSNL